jgi:UDP-3-O-[3-hydroxymyristoyl] glucosamine N-acyltransferase
VRIGAHTAIAGCTGIAGSADIGRHCTIGGNAQIIGHIKIADNVTVSACTVISHSLLKPGTYTGLYPSEEHSSWLRNTAVVRHLAALLDRVRKLEAKEKQRG